MNIIANINNEYVQLIYVTKSYNSAKTQNHQNL